MGQAEEAGGAHRMRDAYRAFERRRRGEGISMVCWLPNNWPAASSAYWASAAIPCPGRVAILGLGGIFAEFMKDVVFHRCPFGEDIATEMIPCRRCRPHWIPANAGMTGRRL